MTLFLWFMGPSPVIHKYTKTNTSMGALNEHPKHKMISPFVSVIHLCLHKQTTWIRMFPAFYIFGNVGVVTCRKWLWWRGVCPPVPPKQASLCPGVLQRHRHRILHLVLSRNTKMTNKSGGRFFVLFFLLHGAHCFSRAVLNFIQPQEKVWELVGTNWFSVFICHEKRFDLHLRQTPCT